MNPPMEQPSAPLGVKPKRKYTRKVKPVPLVIGEEVILPPRDIVETTDMAPKPKRKYTRKVKPPTMPMEPSVVPQPMAEPVVPVGAEVAPKPKRKYTRKVKPPTMPMEPSVVPQPMADPASALGAEVAPKPKRKYTRKVKPPTMAEPVPSQTDIKPSPRETIVIPVPTPVTMPTRQNESYIQLMKDLAFIMRKRKEPMRARAYDHARETIEAFTEHITSPVQLKGKPGIGPTIYEKLTTYTETGTLKILDEERETLVTKRAMDIFTQIYGVGEKKAEEIVSKGVTTLEQLQEREAELLNDKQRIGLRYYHDILERIPREEIVEYETLFRESLPEGMKLEVVGSYRRGLASSGDIDVILTAQDPTLFKEFLNRIRTKNILLETLSCGDTKCLVITRLTTREGAGARRVDFLYTNPQEFPFAILYFTGSKGFNTKMREHALTMHYTLNEHGLSRMEGKKKGALVETEFPTEKAIFDFLKLEYRGPEARVDGYAVVPLGSGVGVASEPVVAPKKRVVKRTVKPVAEMAAPAAAPATLEVAAEVPAEGPAPVCQTVSEVPLNHIHQFQQQGISVLASLGEPQLAAMVEAANNAFHCLGAPVMTDAEYDILREYIEEKYPKSGALVEVGATVLKNKAPLPYEMASMDKIKPDTHALVAWKAKYPGGYVISAKLDGVSGLYTTEGPVPKLYTRGDGKVGQDISYLIPHLKLPTEAGIVVRGEFIIRRSVFDTKYKARFANSRNLVAGIVNSKTLDDKVRDMDFVAYEVIRPANLTPSAQFTHLGGMNILTVKHELVEPASKLTNEYLSGILQDWRTNYTYEIDGIIVSDDHVYPRVSGNPDHSFAFKMVLSDQMAETHVVDVEWVASKDGYLKPTVHVQPVHVSGVTIKKATGFNADFIEKNRIGVGAIVQIIRSGDVIPYIKSVTAPATVAKMPTVPYTWNSTHIDIMLENAADDLGVRTKQITGFFQALEVDGVGEGNVKKLVAAGFDRICKITQMTEADFLSVNGFQEKSAKKFVASIRERLAGATLATLMSASNIFGRGFGQRKMELIHRNYPRVLDMGERDPVKVAQIEGMARKTAEEFVSHIPAFVAFLEECHLEHKLGTGVDVVGPETAGPGVPVGGPGEPEVVEVDTTHPLFGKTVVMTGFRSKVLEERLKAVGAKNGSSVSRTTLAVLVKDRASSSGKVKDAEKLGVPIYTEEEFTARYFP